MGGVEREGEGEINKFNVRHIGTLIDAPLHALFRNLIFLAVRPLKPVRCFYVVPLSSPLLLSMLVVADRSGVGG